MDASDVVRVLGLVPHPEGGWYRETWRDKAAEGGRGAGTAIYYLLARGERSRWHRIDATEVWHFYAGDPLRVELWAGAGSTETYDVGVDIEQGQRPQVVVPAGAWQSAHPLGEWTLAGCTVSPAFDFAAFELAPDGWEPTG